MEQIAAFKTADGRVFESKEMAESHEMGQMMTGELDAFTKLSICPYRYGVANVQMRKSIIAWELSRTRLHPQPQPPGMSLNEELEFSYRTSHCLKATGILTMESLLAQSKQSLLQIPNLGRRSLYEIIETLHSRGLQLSDTNPSISVG